MSHSFNLDRFSLSPFSAYKSHRRSIWESWREFRRIPHLNLIGAAYENLGEKILRVPHINRIGAAYENLGENILRVSRLNRIGATCENLGDKILLIPHLNRKGEKCEYFGDKILFFSDKFLFWESLKLLENIFAIILKNSHWNLYEIARDIMRSHEKFASFFLH